MKILLDLLPEERKEELKRARIFRKVIWVETVFLFPVLVMIVILSDNFYVLNLEKNSAAKSYAQQEQQDQYKKLASFQDSFRQANTLSAAALNFQNKHLYWTNALAQLGAVFPDNITLTNISTNDFKMTVAGKAKTRDDLLNFQSKLQQSACFQNVDLPLSDMVQKSDIDFQIDFDVTNSCLAKKI